MPTYLQTNALMNQQIAKCRLIGSFFALFFALAGCHSAPLKPSVMSPSGAANTTSAPLVSIPNMTPASSVLPPAIEVFHPAAHSLPPSQQTQETPQNLNNGSGKTSNDATTNSARGADGSHAQVDGKAASNAAMIPILAQPITTLGENSNAVFSPDGSKILFTSKGRVSHRQSQAYELHLGSMSERRITFQDGDVSSASYYPDGTHFIYASTTDEIKEEALYVQNIFKTYLPEALPKKSKAAAKHESELTNLASSDIYRESFDGREIERLTNFLGFDGEPSVDAKGRKVIFTSDRSGTPNLYVYNRRGLSRLTDGDSPDRYGRFSPDSKAVLWSRFGKDYKSSTLMLAEGSVKKSLAITDGKSLDLHPTWSPDGKTIVFSSNRGGKDFDLYSMSRDGKCLKQLTDVAGDELFPTFNPDGTKLLFTGNQSGSHQIYLMDFKPGEACLPSH